MDVAGAHVRDTAEVVEDDRAGRMTLALKEWGAAIHALLQGRQTILLRKGGIHEKAFTTPEQPGGILLFPTVAHTHAERTRAEHHDLLPLGEADASDDHVVVRAGAHIIDAIEVTRPDRLPDIADAHIWTDASIQQDRVEFRPKKPLTVLVVQAVRLPEPVVLPRVEAYGGCASWLDLHMAWDGEGRPVAARQDLEGVAERVRRAVSDRARPKPGAAS